MAHAITPHDARHPEHPDADGRINAVTADWLSRHAEGKSEIRPELSNGAGFSHEAREAIQTQTATAEEPREWLRLPARLSCLTALGRAIPPKSGKTPDLTTSLFGIARRGRHGRTCLPPQFADAFAGRSRSAVDAQYLLREAA